MRKIAFRNLVLAFSFIVFIVTNTHASEIAKLIIVKGNVEVVRADYTLEGKKGIKLLEDDIVITKTNSLAVISYFNDSTIKLDQNSKVMIEQMDESASESKSISLKLYLMMGSIIMDFVNPENKKNVEVKARQVSLAVRGTQFFIGIDPEGTRDVYASVNRGKVEILGHTEDDSEFVNGGQGIVIQKGRELTRPLAFQWMRDLNWEMKNVNRNLKSGFFNKKLRAKRVKEVFKRRKDMRNRVRKSFKHRPIFKILRSNSQGKKLNLEKVSLDKVLKDLPKEEKALLKKRLLKGIKGEKRRKRRLDFRKRKRQAPRIITPKPTIKPPTTTRPPTGGTDSDNSTGN